MATTKTDEVVTTTKTDEYVDLFVHRDPGDTDPNVFIGINDNSWLLPKGVISRVPLVVKEEYERSLRAREARLSNSDRLAEKAK
jgi:hypothetical protein